jgi:hypothetical protein
MTDHGCQETMQQPYLSKPSRLAAFVSLSKLGPLVSECTWALASPTDVPSDAPKGPDDDQERSLGRLTGGFRRA